MNSVFQISDPSLESQWRAIILFGKNSATYKFAFAKSLLSLIDNNQSSLRLEEIAVPFSKNIITHLKQNDKQGSSNTSTFLNECRKYIKGQISEDQLIQATIRYGFVNVVDAFQNVNGSTIHNPFYQKDYSIHKKIVLTDNIFRLQESVQFINLNQEVDARWRLVETAWNLQLNPSLLEVKHDSLKQELFVENKAMRRINITSIREALNGYQKGKCFYSFQDIFVNKGNEKICAVDHFLPHINKMTHLNEQVNINGVWNLVLTDSKINLSKSSRIPNRRFLERLYNRNEFYIESKHPLAETIINQTGKTKLERRRFLEKQFYIALQNSIHEWEPEIELPGNF